MIKLLDDVLTVNECEQLINEYSTELRKLDTLGTPIDNYRTADGTWIYKDTELSLKIQNIIANDSGLPIENQEKIHIVKYEIGGEYKPHHDFFHPNTDYYENTMGTAGQRTHSYLFYLNDNFTGGETEFPHKKIKITPKTGRLLIWRNLKENGELDYDSFHAGLPVESDTKYIAIVWVRENSFLKNTILPKPIEVVVNHIDLGEIMTPAQCEFLTNYVLTAHTENKLNLETDTRFYNNSYGGTIDLLWEASSRYLPLVESMIGKNVKVANPYVRIYKNTNTLNKHKDRDGLDWTISLCLFSNLDKDWPLLVEGIDGGVQKYPTKIGEASLVSGHLLEHWREPLECTNDEYVIQMFLHYTQI